MDLGPAEQSIKTRLAPLKALGLRTLPETAAEQGVMSGNGTLSLMWMSDEPGGATDTMSRMQDCVSNWEVDGRVKGLRNPEQGLLKIRQLLYYLTIGFKPDGCGPLYATGFQFLDRENNYWRFKYQMACKSKLIGLGMEEPGDLGVNVAEIFFEVPQITDQWGVSTSQGDLPLPPPII
ncbi:MAG TPA: Gp37 family protein [Trichocoleus sp.]